jgi:hypothetical protein
MLFNTAKNSKMNARKATKLGQSLPLGCSICIDLQQPLSLSLTQFFWGVVAQELATS